MTSRKKRGARRATESRDEPAARETVPAPALPRINRWLLAAVATVTVLAYLPALAAPYVLDDQDTISAAANWSAPPGSPAAGRPLVLATLALNSGINDALGVDQRPDPDGPHKAIGFRLFNLLLHLLTGAALFGVMRRAMRERVVPASWRAIADPTAGIVCALWLLHPIQSEVVDYIVQRSESLASLFYLGVLYASQRAWESSGRARSRWYVLGVVSALLGMASKEIVITAPLMVMLYDRAFRLPAWRPLLSPGSGRGIFYGALWIACAGSFAMLALGARGETAGYGSGIHWYEYLYTQCWAIAHYLRLVVWPAGLAVDYGFIPVRGARGIPGAIVLTAFAAATLWAWTRVERYGWFAFLGSWFFVLLAPSSSVVPVASEIAAERRVYLALAAVIVLAVVGAESARRKVFAASSPRAVTSIFAALAIVLAATTALRSESYRSAELLWRSAAKATPDNPRALGNYGWALYKQPAPKLAEAESVYARAMARDSTCHFGCLQYATVLNAAGNYSAAVPLLERVIARDAGDMQAQRELVFAQRELGLVLMKLGDYARAITNLEPVAQQFPQSDHLAVLGVAYLAAGRHDAALAAFKRVGTFDGGSPQMQQLSAKLTDAAAHPEALGELKQFAFELGKGWM